MFGNRKKVLKYAARLFTLAAAVIIIMKLSGKDLGDSVVPILVLVVASNWISLLLYKQEK